MQQSGLHARQCMQVRQGNNSVRGLVRMYSKYRRDSNCRKAHKKHARQEEGPWCKMCSHTESSGTGRSELPFSDKTQMTAHRPYNAVETARCSTKCCLPFFLTGLLHLLAGGSQRLAWSAWQHP
jgi:hypothetical protein